MKKYSSLPISLLCTVLAGSIACLTASAASLLNDGFDNGSIGPQNLPDSAQWYGSETDNATASSGSMTLDTNGGTTSGMVTGYFTDTGSYSLAAGETLTLSVTFSVAGVDGSTGYFRLGLLNSVSDAKRISTQGEGSNNSQFSNYTGYAMFTNLATFNNNIGLYKRDNANTGLLNAAAAYTSLGSSGSPFQLANSTTYTGTFSLENTGTSIIATQSFSGGSLSGITHTLEDSTDIFTDFNTVAFAIQSSAANSITFDNISVTTSVPEPAQSALVLSGILGLSILALRRRRRA